MGKAHFHKFQTEYSHWTHLQRAACQYLNKFGILRAQIEIFSLVFISVILNWFLMRQRAAASSVFIRSAVSRGRSELFELEISPNFPRLFLFRANVHHTLADSWPVAQVTKKREEELVLAVSCLPSSSSERRQKNLFLGADRLHTEFLLVPVVLLSSYAL